MPLSNIKTSAFPLGLLKLAIYTIVLGATMTRPLCIFHCTAIVVIYEYMLPGLFPFNLQGSVFFRINISK